MSGCTRPHAGALLIPTQESGAVRACVWHMVTRTEIRRHRYRPSLHTQPHSRVTWHHTPAWQTHASARPQPPCDLHNANARPLHKGCLAPPTRSQVEWGREPGEMPGLPGGRQMPSDSVCRFVAQLLGFKSFYYQVARFFHPFSASDSLDNGTLVWVQALHNAEHVVLNSSWLLLPLGFLTTRTCRLSRPPSQFVCYRPLQQSSLRPGSILGLHSPPEAQCDAQGAQVGRLRGPRGVTTGRQQFHLRTRPSGQPVQRGSWLSHFSFDRLS